MNTRAKLVDYLTFIGIPAVGTALAIGAVLTPQTWSVAGTVILITSLVAMWSLSVAILLRLRSFKPDFISHGCAFWLDMKIKVPKRVVDAAMEHFKKHIVTSRLATVAQVNDLFSKASFTISDNPVHYKGKDYNGLSNGRSLALRWMKGFKQNAFFHEWMHSFQEIVLKIRDKNGRPDRDYQHLRRSHWELVARMKNSFIAP